MENHKAGFVNIIGSPNVGKSTLMNQLLGEKISIVTPKAQTTRHRILGILNEPEYQIVFSDTPGVVNAAYELHNTMMNYVDTAIEDADIILLVTDVFENVLNHEKTFEKIKDLKIPILILVNKIDLKEQEEVAERLQFWANQLPAAKILPISALHKFNIEAVMELIIEHLPFSPPYFDKEEFTDRTMRFFVSEIIREQIFLNLKKEVPYSCQVEVTDYKESEDRIYIRALIIVEKDSQKAIVIGEKGKRLKQIGIESRKNIEKFVEKHIYLETKVKVDKDWRSDKNKLRKYGY